MKSKSRLNKEGVSFEPHDCKDSGGVYQELKSLGSFAEALPGTRAQRLHERDYCKTNHEKKPDIIESLLKEDTSGPPFENTSKVHRVL